jgi:hypothetical protein
MNKEIGQTDEDGIRKAYREWEDAKNFFEYVSEPELVDYAVYAIEATKRRFLYMLRQCRQHN